MLFVKLTRTGAGRYDGEVFVNALLVVSMQRIGDRTSVAFMVPGRPDEGGMEGLDVVETPEQIVELARQAADR